MKIQSLNVSNGNRYIEGISNRLSVTSITRLFTNTKKLKSLFSHKTPMKGFGPGKKGCLSYYHKKLKFKLKTYYHSAIGRT